MTAQRTCAHPDVEPPSSLGPDADALTDALGRIPDLRDVPCSIEPLPGGLTNRIYKVQASTGRTVVARVSGKSSLLQIDRHAECHNSVAAAQSGAGPRVVLCDPEAGISVVDWIEGRTLTDHDLDDANGLARVAQTCRVLHGGARCVNDFDMFEIQRRYLAVVQSRGFRLPARYLDFADDVQQVRTALAVHPEPTVPCHNDLLAANIMDDGERLWLIDFEYAGNNDPCFELGNIWSEADLAVERLAELVEAYYGSYSPAKFARAWLLGLMSKYGWTLWASIQAEVSEVEFDFWSWGMAKYERAVEEFDGPEFSRLIRDVQQPN